VTMYMLSALQFVLIGPRTTLSKIASTSSLADACQKTINICCCEVQRESDPPGQYPRLKQQGHHEALTQLGGTYGEVGCMIEDMLIGVLNCLTVRTSRFQSPLASCSYNKCRSQRCHLLWSKGTWRGVTFTNDVSRNQRSVR